MLTDTICSRMVVVAVEISGDLFTNKNHDHALFDLILPGLHGAVILLGGRD